MATIIHTFLYDPDFVNNASITGSVLKTGGMCVLSPQALSYFVTPQEFADERTIRSTALNALLTGVPKLVVDESQFQSFLADINNVWSSVERQNFFAIVDQLLFAYNSNATQEQVEEALATWPQYVASSFVYSNTVTTATAYIATPTNITIPDYVTFFFQIGNGTQYEIRVWANNTVFMADYPISTIADVVPPLPLSQLYTLDLVAGVANVFTTALATAQLSQTSLAPLIQSGEYTGFIGQDVTFVDGNGNTTQVQFNILYNGAVPGAIAIRAAIRNLLLNSGVGNEAGWQARAPSIFVTQLWYILPLWDNKTSQVASVVYPNIVGVALATTDATKVLYDISSGFINANIDVVTAFYNNMTLVAVPDTENASNRLSLANEHPTYQDVGSTNPAFNYMATTTQQFSALLNAALSVAAGNANTNGALTMYTAPGDNRTYVSFSVADVEYYVITQSTYLNLVNPPA
jgi:hypothetical protein